MKAYNAKFNSAYILHQKEEIDEKKREFKLREGQYYKPHFGPEETEECVLWEKDRQTKQRSYVKDQLSKQIQLKTTLQTNDFVN